MKKIIGLLTALLLSAAMAGCGAPSAEPEPTPEPTPEPIVFSCGSFEADSESLTLVLQEGESALLERFPKLKVLDLTGSRCYDEILAFRETHPEVRVICDVQLPDGQLLASDAVSVDLSSLRHGEAEETVRRLSLLPALAEIDLGERPAEPGEEDLRWEDVGAFQKAFPGASVLYRFRLFDKDFTTLDERMILSHRQMDDDGAAVREVLPYMVNCSFLDMDSCGVDNRHMAAIRDDFPDIKVVWRVWFGDVYTCRTDVKRLLASSEGHSIDDWNADGLYYCTDVVHMDIGHSNLHDLSFLYNMPDLEVLIVACAPWKDGTPIGSLEKLEYLEILSTSCNDISSFSNLHNLKHLNIGNCHHITDISSLYGLTQLERLWIGCITPVPKEQKDRIRELLPDTVINTTTANHKSEGWCKDETGHNVPRYALLREQFGDYQMSAYAYDWSDILYKKSLDELTEEELLLVKP
ncbi:MAG: leucine-rich repeat domain-containing protein [Oscillospiraceae bacterium]|nr:leucine-rich repeat domain-containing protein [Oscillospiraceae bacterium]